MPPTPVAAPSAEQMRWDSYHPRYQALIDAPVDALQAPQWLREWSDLSAEISEVSALLALRADLNTADEAAQQQLQSFQSEVVAPSSLSEQALRRKLLSIPDYQPAPDFALAYRRMRDQAAFFREENVTLNLSLIHI